jgi:hypothetical protein
MCPRLIGKFLKRSGEVSFVPPEQVMRQAEKRGVTRFEVPSVEFGHHGKGCSFAAILKEYHLTGDPALALACKNRERRGPRQ